MTTLSIAHINRGTRTEEDVIRELARKLVKKWREEDKMKAQKLLMKKQSA